MGALGCTGACHSKNDPQTKVLQERGRAAAGDLLKDMRDRLSPPPLDEVGLKSSWRGVGSVCLRTPQNRFGKEAKGKA